MSRHTGTPMWWRGRNEYYPGCIEDRWEEEWNFILFLQYHHPEVLNEIRNKNQRIGWSWTYLVHTAIVHYLPLSDKDLLSRKSANYAKEPQEPKGLACHSSSSLKSMAPFHLKKNTGGVGIELCSKLCLAGLYEALENVLTGHLWCLYE